MARVRGSVAVVLTVAAACAGGPAAAKVKLPGGPWTEVVTEHYDVFGNAYADHLREAAARLEQIRAVLAESGLDWSADSGPRTVVCAFRDWHAFTRNVAARRSKGLVSDGEFRDEGVAPTIVVDLGAYDGLGVLSHEGVHDAVARRFLNLPDWLSEGLAETFATLRVEDGTVTLGPEALTAYGLYFHSRISLDLMFSTDEAKIDARSFVPLYKWSWAFVYYATVVRPGGASALHRFAIDLNRGLPVKKSFEAAFGCSYETIQEEMDTYYRTKEPKRIPLAVAAVPDPHVPDAVPLTRDEVLVRLGDVMTSGDDRILGLARRYLKAFLKRHPADPRALAAFAEIEAREGHAGAAAEGFERAIAAHSEESKVFFRAAWNLVIPQMTDDSVPDAPPAKLPEPIVRARRHLARMLVMRPDDPAGLWLLGITYAWDPGDPSPGIDALRRSDAASPLGAHSLLVLLRFLVRTKNLAAARDLLASRLEPLENAEMTRRARGILTAADSKAKPGSPGRKP